MPSPTYSANGIKIEGLTELRRSIIAMGVPREEMNAAAAASAELVKREAISLVPVRSGKLRDSIRITKGRFGTTQISAGNNRKTKSGIPYANPIHWGWFKRNILPQPFFAKALGITREQVFKTYEHELQAKINAEYRRQRAASRRAAIEEIGYTNVIPIKDGGFIGFTETGARKKLSASESIRLRSKLAKLGY